MNDHTGRSCRYCEQPATNELEVEPARVRKNSKGQVVSDLPIMLDLCDDCHAGLLAHRAEDAAARYRAMAVAQGFEQQRWC